MYSSIGKEQEKDIATKPVVFEKDRLTISLQDLMGSETGWGHKRGASVAEIIRSHIEELANEQAGIEWVIREIEAGKTLILLCACKEEKLCHRRLIYDKVRIILGTRLPELQSGQRVMTPHGLGTIDPYVPINIQRARNRYGVKLDDPGPRIGRILVQNGSPSVVIDDTVVLKPRYFGPHELQPYSIVQPLLALERDVCLTQK